MTDLKTNESLLSALRAATTRTPTAEELNKQRVSFIIGTLKESSGVTRSKVQEVLDKQEGKRGPK
jgi:hypothetical protein